MRSVLALVVVLGTLQQSLFVPSLGPAGTDLDIFVQGVTYGPFKPALQARVTSTPSHILLLF